jgi:hypothetical protein
MSSSHDDHTIAPLIPSTYATEKEHSYISKSASTTETELDAKSLNALIAEIDESLQEVDTTIVYPAPKPRS